MITGRNRREMQSGERKGKRNNGMRQEDDSQNSSFQSFPRSSGDPG